MTDTPQERIKRNAVTIKELIRHLNGDELRTPAVAMIREHCRYILGACDEIEKSG